MEKSRITDLVDSIFAVAIRLRFLFILPELLFGFSWLSISSLLAGSEFEIHATSKIRQGQFSVKVLLTTPSAVDSEQDTKSEISARLFRTAGGKYVAGAESYNGTTEEYEWRAALKAESKVAKGVATNCWSPRAWMDKIGSIP